MNCIIKNLPQLADENENKASGIKVVRAILNEANLDGELVVKVERHPARQPGREGVSMIGR